MALAVPSDVVAGFGETEAAVAGLEDGALYACSVVSRRGEYVSEPATISVTAAETGEEGGLVVVRWCMAGLGR